MDDLKPVLHAREVHGTRALRTSFEGGLDPNTRLGGNPICAELAANYLRGHRFRIKKGFLMGPFLVLWPVGCQKAKAEPFRNGPLPPA